MNVRRIAAALTAALCCVQLSAPASVAYCDTAASAPEPMGEVGFDLQASSMALIEAETGTLLAGQNCDIALPMASTTKIMTALIVLKNCNTDDMVKVPDEAVGTEGSSMYLCRGETVKVIDLLYGLMLASGNDAAVALAFHTAGSVEGFAELMNKEAEELGLTSTHFVTPNGLHAEGHETTAYELCLIAREALKLPEFRKIVSSQYYTTVSGDHPRTFKNKNSLLWDYEGAVGVKTGYTMAAGRCLVFAAERGGMTVIGALLNCRPMFEKAEILLDYAFEEFTLCTVIPAGWRAPDAKVENGEQSVLPAEAKNAIIAVMRKGERASFTASVSFSRLTAPIEAGETVGFVTVSLNGREYGRTELVASQGVKTRDILFWLRLLAGAFA